MKKTVLLTVLFTILLIAVTQLSKAQSLVAHYPFSGNANDASGNGNNGTVNGATLTTDRFGNANSAYSFNGSTNWIEVPNSSSIQLGSSNLPYTIMAWVKPNSFYTGLCQSNLIISKGDNSSGEGHYNIQYGDFLDGSCGSYTPAQENFATTFRKGGIDNAAYTTPATVPVLGNWYMVAATYDGTNLKLYLNGTLIATQVTSGTMGSPNTSNLFIGRHENPAYPYFVNGVIDDIKMYKGALTPQQIGEEFANGSTVAYYPFSGNANDASGNGHLGTLNGTTTLTTDRFGNANSAYLFDGSTGYISVPQNTAFNFGNNDFTIRAWVNAAGFNPGRRIIGAGYGVNDGIWSLGIGINGAWGSNIRMNSVFYTGGSYLDINTPAELNVTSNSWYQVCMVRTSGTIRFFVNGKFVGSNPVSSSVLANPASALLIGARSNANPGDIVEFFQGKLDEIEIYNAALSDAMVFDDYVNDLKKPGSGNSLLFDNTQFEFLEIGNGWDEAGSFSFETWVKRTSTAITDPDAQAFIVSTNVGGWGVGINQNAGAGPVGALFLTKVGISQVLSSTTIADINWHHVAVTYNAGTNQVIFYIDGVAGAPVSYSPGGFNSGNTSYRLGGRYAPAGNALNGQLEETRIWSGIVLTETQIRDWMCRKLSSSHSSFSSLTGYFRYDEGSGTTTGGYNTKFGTFNNTPDWLTSGASLGDAASHDFVNAIKTANISHASGENFAVTSTSGSPAGIVVYRVDEQPNSNTGANNGGNNKYFGVFQSGGTTPQYTAVYNYTGNPLVNAGNESSLRLAKRTDNSVTSWTQMAALPNEPANTITVTGESTEYILGQVGGALPVTLLNFAGSKCNSNVCLLWSTENEQNFSHFEIEKSNNGNSFSYLASVTARNLPQRNTYNSIDITPFNGVNFYRLKIVNLDGSFSYSYIIRIDIGKPAIVSVQPNPANDIVIVKGAEGYNQLRIFDLAGRLQLQMGIKNSIEEINIGSLPAGMYLLRLTNNKEMVSIKLIKQ